MRPAQLALGVHTPATLGTDDGDHTPTASGAHRRRRGGNVVAKDDLGGWPFGSSKSKPVNPARVVVTVCAGRLEASVAKHALGSVLAKARQVVGARNLFHVPMAALGPVLAETARKVGALVPLLLRVDVSVHALGVGALAKLGEEVAFGHLGEVELVEILAKLVLLAQAPQPMLAHDEPVVARVAVLAAGAFGAALRRKEKAAQVRAPAFSHVVIPPLDVQLILHLKVKHLAVQRRGVKLGDCHGGQ